MQNHSNEIASFVLCVASHLDCVARAVQWPIFHTLNSSFRPIELIYIGSMGIGVHLMERAAVERHGEQTRNETCATTQRPDDAKTHVMRHNLAMRHDTHVRLSICTPLRDVQRRFERVPRK